MRPCSSCPPSSAGARFSDMLAASRAISRLGDAHQPYSAERLDHGSARLSARLGCGPAWIGVDMPVKCTGWEFAERLRDEDIAPPLYLPLGHRNAAGRSTARINLGRTPCWGMPTPRAGTPSPLPCPSSGEGQPRYAVMAASVLFERAEGTRKGHRRGLDVTRPLHRLAVASVHPCPATATAPMPAPRALQAITGRPQLLLRRSCSPPRSSHSSQSRVAATSLTFSWIGARVLRAEGYSRSSRCGLSGSAGCKTVISARPQGRQAAPCSGPRFVVWNGTDMPRRPR